MLTIEVVDYIIDLHNFSNGDNKTREQFMDYMTRQTTVLFQITETTTVTLYYFSDLERFLKDLPVVD